MKAQSTDDPSLIAKYSRFSIILLSVLIAVNLVIAIGFQNRGFPDGTLRMVILVIILILAWFTDRKGFVSLAKCLFVGGIYWAFFLYPLMPIFDSKPAEDIFLYIFILLLLSSLVVVVFEAYQWWVMVLAMIVLLVTFYTGFYDAIRQLNDSEFTLLGDMFLTNKELGFGIIISALLLSFITWKFKNEQLNAQKLLLDASVKLHSKEQEVNDQNKELKQVANHLEISQKELEEVNNSLQLRVDNRIEELADINDRIIKYGFIQSTLIKSSFENKVLQPELFNNMREIESRELIAKMVEELDGLLLDIAENLKVADRNLS